MIIRIKIKMQVYVAMRWRDEFLRWDAGELKMGRVIRVKPTDIWIPEVGFLNAKENFEILKEVTIFPIRFHMLLFETIKF